MSGDLEPDDLLEGFLSADAFDTLESGAHDPSRVGPYALGRVLGRGGMGVVYRARHVETGEEVALKLVELPRASHDQARRRFQREARALLALRHPHIVAVREVGEHQGRPFLALELVEGGNLDARLERSGPLDPAAAAALVGHLARAVDYVHAQGLLHRDLKPGNVLLDGETPRLTDFGLVKAILPAGDRVSAADCSLTASGQMLGTPGYWAPELAVSDGVPPDSRTDVFGLGAILYAALTGRPPFTGHDLRHVVAATLSGAVLPPSQLREGIPRALDRICLRALAGARADRYPSALALAEALDGWQTPTATRAAWIAAVALVGAGLALGLVAAKLAGPSASPPTSLAAGTPAVTVAATPTPERLRLWSDWRLGAQQTYRYSQESRGTDGGYDMSWTWRQEATDVEERRVRFVATFTRFEVTVNQAPLPRMDYDTDLPDEGQPRMLQPARAFLGGTVEVSLDPLTAEFLSVNGFDTLPQRVGLRAPIWFGQMATLMRDSTTRTVLNLACRHLPAEPLEPGVRTWSRRVDVRVSGMPGEAVGAFRLQRVFGQDDLIEWRVEGQPEWPPGVPPLSRYQAHGTSRWGDGLLLDAQAEQEARSGDQWQRDAYRLQLIRD